MLIYSKVLGILKIETFPKFIFENQILTFFRTASCSLSFKIISLMIQKKKNDPGWKWKAQILPVTVESWFSTNHMYKSTQLNVAWKEFSVLFVFLRKNTRATPVYFHVCLKLLLHAALKNTLPSARKMQHVEDFVHKRRTCVRVPPKVQVQSSSRSFICLLSFHFPVCVPPSSFPPKMLRKLTTA